MADQHYDSEFELEEPLYNARSIERWRISNIRKPFLFIVSALSKLSILFPRHLNPTSGKSSHQLHPTAYLDALRGYASWIVYNGHVVHEDWRPPEHPLMQYSVFRYMFKGNVQVDIFFVISGYALSYRMVQYMHANQPNQALESLASSVFRRYLRLYLPVTAASFVSMVAVSTHLAVQGEGPPVLQETAWGNLHFWILDVIRTSNPFAFITGWWYGGVFCTPYLPQMWSIPVEFRGSILLFVFCAATCKIPARKRMVLTWACVVAFTYWQAHYVGLFLGGMGVADLRLLHAKRNQDSILVRASTTTTYSLNNENASEDSLQPELTSSPASHKSNITSSGPTILQQLPYITIAIMSITPLTAPQPVFLNSPFPHNIIAYLIPDNYDPGARLHFPLTIGAIMLVYGLDNAPILQKPLMTSFSQWLGELSFGIYVVHQTVRWVVWEQMLLKWHVSFWGSPQTGFFYLLPPYIIFTIIIVWAAELFRMLDVRIVAWVKKLEKWCFA